MRHRGENESDIRTIRIPAEKRKFMRYLKNFINLSITAQRHEFSELRNTIKSKQCTEVHNSTSCIKYSA